MAQGRVQKEVRFLRALAQVEDSIFEQQSSVFIRFQMWLNDNFWTDFGPIRSAMEEKMGSEKDVRKKAENLKPLRKR